MDPLETSTFSSPAIPNVDLGAPIGRGAFGAVFLGRHRSLDVDVAVKLVSAEGADAAALASLDRALSEARLMARLDHPNLLRILDAGRVGSTLYMVLEYMDGGLLSSLRRTPADRLLDIARQLASALQAMHDARIVHRDIKPANCLTRADGRVKLADLGIAAEVRTRVSASDFAGTLPFMAPELLTAPPRYGPRSDLYALGLTLACMALDADPFPTGSPSEIVAWVASGRRPEVARVRPDLPPPLTRAIERMLAASVDDRPVDAAEVLALLTGDVLRLGPGVAPASASETPTEPGGARVGPWVLGDPLYSSSNWLGYAVTHARTGAAARLSQLRPRSWLRQAAPVILESAARGARLDHPGLLAVLDWGEREGCPYIVTLPQGRNLLELVRSSGPLDEVEALRLAADLAEALAYVHAEGLVYQMVEPGSCLATRDARSAQLGWPMYCVPAGSAATGEDGKPRRVFVPGFASPEAFTRKGTIDPASDLWGLGEVLYFLLAGRAAFGGSTAPECLAARTQPPAPLLEVAPEVTRPTAELVASLLAIEPELRGDPARRGDPASRGASAAAVGDQLRRIARRLGG